jgi:hypothetical protein
MGVVSMKNKPYKTRYAGAHKRKGRRGGVTVTLPVDPRRGICDACKKSVAKGEIKSTHLHHWWYEFQPKTVKENPMLVLKNTSELCFYCHQLADAVRALIYARPIRVAWVVKCLKGNQLEKFLKILEEVLKSLRKTEKNISPLAQSILERTRNGKE